MRYYLYLIAALLIWAAPLRAQTSLPPLAPIDKTLRVGDSEIYEFDRMTTAAVGSPSIADIVPLTARRLLVNAKAAGETTLFVYDRHGQHRLHLTVVLPAPDLTALAAQVQTEIGLPNVTVHAVKDTLFLEGAVPSVVGLQRAGAIAAVYTLKVKNLVTILPSPESAPPLSLAQTYAALLTSHLTATGIQVQVIDEKTIALSGQYTVPRSQTGESRETPLRKLRPRTAKRAPKSDAADDAPPKSVPEMDLTAVDTKPRPEALSDDPLERLLQSLPPELNVVDLINFGSHPLRQILIRAKVIDIDRNASKSLGVDWGSLVLNNARGGNIYSFQSQPILFGQAPNGGGTSQGSLLGGGSLQRFLPFAAQLSALITENKARVLSEPSLMVLDGCEGSILVGGEIPIPVAQASTGSNGSNASISIEYKPYGVRLSVNAAIVGENKIQMTVTPEVSDLNYGATVQIGGSVIPSLTVRRATSTLQMGDGETLVIGGLYSNTTSRQVVRIPLLSQIPVLGEFFKNTTTRKEESELLILIEPEIVTPDTVGAHPPPSGSLENLPIARPDVRRGDFDKDFPELQHGDRDHTGPPVDLPPAHSPMDSNQEAK